MFEYFVNEEKVDEYNKKVMNLKCNILLKVNIFFPEKRICCKVILTKLD